MALTFSCLYNLAVLCIGCSSAAETKHHSAGNLQEKVGLDLTFQPDKSGIWQIGGVAAGAAAAGPEL